MSSDFRRPDAKFISDDEATSISLMDSITKNSKQFTGVFSLFKYLGLLSFSSSTYRAMEKRLINGKLMRFFTIYTCKESQTS